MLTPEEAWPILFSAYKSLQRPPSITSRFALRVSVKEAIRRPRAESCPRGHSTAFLKLISSQALDLNLLRYRDISRYVNSRPLLDQLEETMVSTEKLRVLLQSMLAERDRSFSAGTSGVCIVSPINPVFVQIAVLVFYFVEPRRSLFVLLLDCFQSIDNMLRECTSVFASPFETRGCFIRQLV